MLIKVPYWSVNKVPLEIIKNLHSGCWECWGNETFTPCGRIKKEHLNKEQLEYLETLHCERRKENE